MADFSMALHGWWLAGLLASGLLAGGLAAGVGIPPFSAGPRTRPAAAAEINSGSDASLARSYKPAVSLSNALHHPLTGGADALNLLPTGWMQSGLAIERKVSDTPSCPRCRITLSPVVRLGVGDSLISEWPQSMVRDSRGRYYLALPNRQEPPMVFDATGKFLGRIGTIGDGPGEHRLASHLALDATDTLYVADRAGRLNVFGPDYKFVRRAEFPSANGLVVLADRSLVVGASVPDRATVGLPFHLFRRDGYRTSAIGDRMLPHRGAQGLLSWYKLARSRRGGFWAVPIVGNYRIEHWNRSGGREVLLTRAPGWFIRYPTELLNPDLSKIDPPVSMVEAAWEDSTGLIWVVSKVADPARKQAGERIVTTPEGPARISANPDRSWDSMIEVIDPGTGKLVASLRSDLRLSLGIAEGLVAHISDDAEGRIVIGVTQLRLIRR